MLSCLLVLAYAAGIVWADCSRSIPLVLAGALLVAGLGLCFGLSTAIQNGHASRPCVPGRSRQSRRLARSSRSSLSGRSTRGLRGAGLFCAIGLFFLAGFDRLDGTLEDAASDRALAELGKGEGVRLAQARVRGRRRLAWGDEVELESVRAIDSGSALPERLLLRLEQDSDDGVGSGRSRADLLLWPGTWVRIGFRIRPLQAPRNPGTTNREHREARRGLGARARLVKPDWVIALSDPSSEWIDLASTGFNAARRDSWRQRVATRFEEEGVSAGLVRALALGDRGGISLETRAAFRHLGLSHLVAISGLHIGFIAGLAGWLGLRTTVWLCPCARRIRVFDWALGIACFAAAFYAWMSDAGVSVERASMLFGLYALCRLVLRRIAPVSALAWVALAILWVDPAALFDVGAQLSFAACSALIAAGFWQSDPGPIVEIEEPVSTRSLRVLGTTFRTSLVVSLGTAPLLVQHGLAMSTLAPLFNVLAIPWTGLIVLPCSLVVVSMIEVLPPLIVQALVLPAAALEAAALALDGVLPEEARDAFLAMPFFIVLIGIGLFANRRGRWVLATIVWGVASLAGVSPISFEAPLVAAPRVIFFDVGQGDAALIQGREAVLLIDTGPGPPDGSGGTALIRALKVADVRRIDILVLTHGDLDHRAGLLRVLETFEVDELWLPGSRPRDEVLAQAASMARAHGTKVLWQDADRARPTRVGLDADLDIEVLWPIEGSRGVGASRNERSLVLRVAMEKKTFLFTADIGIEVENELMRGPKRLDADILKIAHHGSRSSSSAAFLHRVSPVAAVLSAPCDPARGLPNGLAVERIRQSGAELWWTGRDGAVLVAGEIGQRPIIRGWGKPRKCAVR